MTTRPKAPNRSTLQVLLLVQIVALLVGVAAYLAAGGIEWRWAIQIVQTIQILCALGYLKMANGLPTKVIPLSSMFIFFLSLFYTVRGWAHLTLKDDNLMYSLGVYHTELYTTQALGLVTVFLAILVLAYASARTVTLIPRLMHKLFSGLFFRAPATEFTGMSALLVIMTVAVLDVLATVVVSYFIDATGSKDVLGGFGLYLVSLPFIPYGAVAVAWGALLTDDRMPGPVRLGAMVPFGLLICLGAWFAREASIYRIYYLAPLVIMVFALFPKRFTIGRFLLVCAITLPILTFMSQTRYVEVKDHLSAVEEKVSEALDEGIAAVALAPFASEGGDFTCLDIFASALAHEQQFRPWGLSFLYPVAHVIPRALWKDKPEKGMLTDRASFLTVVGDTSGYVIPYYAGVVGEFYLEGWLWFIPLGAVLVGLALKAVDQSMAQSYHSNPKARFLATYSLLAFLLFFSIRTVPYQLVYFGGFTFIGFYLASRFFSSGSPLAVLRRSQRSSQRPRYSDHSNGQRMAPLGQIRDQ